MPRIDAGRGNSGRRSRLEHAERSAPSAVAARLVPYGFARSGQILVAHQHADGLEVWISERTSDAALAEVARNFGALVGGAFAG